MRRGNSFAAKFWPQASSLENASLLTVNEQTPSLFNRNFILNSVPCTSSNPWMRAWFAVDAVEVDEWPLGTNLKLEIEDMTTPGTPDYSAQAVVTEDYFTPFNLVGQFDIKPGTPTSRRDPCTRKVETSLIYVMPTCRLPSIPPSPRETPVVVGNFVR